MLYRITLTKLHGYSESRVVSAPDEETARDFAEDQRDAYGCHSASVSLVLADEIEKNTEILYLD